MRNKERLNRKVNLARIWEREKGQTCVLPRLFFGGFFLQGVTHDNCSTFSSSGPDRHLVRCSDNYLTDFSSTPRIPQDMVPGHPRNRKNQWLQEGSGDRESQSFKMMVVRSQTATLSKLQAVKNVSAISLKSSASRSQNKPSWWSDWQVLTAHRGAGASIGSQYLCSSLRGPESPSGRRVHNWCYPDEICSRAQQAAHTLHLDASWVVGPWCILRRAAL